MEHWESFLNQTQQKVLNYFFVIFCVMRRAVSWGFGINVSFTSWSSATLLIFDTSKMLTTVSFWGFSFIPQLDSHWAAGGSLWIPHPLATRPGRSGAGSEWPLSSGAEFGVFVDLTLASIPAHYSKQSFEILQSVKNALKYCWVIYKSLK